MRMKVMALVFGLAGAAPALADDVTVIRSYRPDKAGTVLAFDAAGKPLGKVATSALPPIDSPILEVDSKTRKVAVQGPDGPIWLLPAQVEISARARAASDCRYLGKLGQDKNSVLRNYHGTLGLGEGC